MVLFNIVFLLAIGALTGFWIFLCVLTLKNTMFLVPVLVLFAVSFYLNPVLIWFIAKNFWETTKYMLLGAAIACTVISFSSTTLLNLFLTVSPVAVPQNFILVVFLLIWAGLIILTCLLHCFLLFLQFLKLLFIDMVSQSAEETLAQGITICWKFAFWGVAIVSLGLFVVVLRLPMHSFEAGIAIVSGPSFWKISRLPLQSKKRRWP